MYIGIQYQEKIDIGIQYQKNIDMGTSPGRVALLPLFNRVFAA
jgi:hypothetical protein